MQLKEFDILLDIKKHNKSELFEVVQGDSESNVLNITLVDGINSFNLTNTSVEIVFNKSDGTTVQQTDIGVLNASQGKIQCVLKTNTIASPGKVVAEVRVLEGEILLTSTRFEFYVRKSLINDETIESTNEFPILTQLIKDVEPILDAVPIIDGKLDEITNTESDLNQSILEGNSLKSDLDNSIAQGNILKPELESVIIEGEGIKGELEDIIAGTDFEQVITDLNNKVDKEVVGDPDDLETTEKTIVAAINEVNNKSVDLTPVEDRIGDLETDLGEHKAEIMSQVVAIDRDISLSGIQTIITPINKKIKGIYVCGSITSTFKTTNGAWSSNNQAVQYNRGDNVGYLSNTGYSIAVSENSTVDRTFGKIQNVSNGSFDIDWTKVGVGATGIAKLIFLVFYHGE